VYSLASTLFTLVARLIEDGVSGVILRSHADVDGLTAGAMVDKYEAVYERAMGQRTSVR